MYNYIYRHLNNLLALSIDRAYSHGIVLVGDYSKAWLANGADKLLDEYLEGDYNDLDIDNGADRETQLKQMTYAISKGARFGDYQDIISLNKRLLYLQDRLEEFESHDVSPANIYGGHYYNDTFRVWIYGGRADLKSEALGAVDELSELDKYLKELVEVSLRPALWVEKGIIRL